MVDWMEIFSLNHRRSFSFVWEHEPQREKRHLLWQAQRPVVTMHLSMFLKNPKEGGMEGRGERRKGGWEREGEGEEEEEGGGVVGGKLTFF